jgi:hypothetical protein
MLRMVSYPHRLQSGHITCYLNRTYHVLPTLKYLLIDSAATSEHNVSARFGHARPPSARNLKFIPAFYLGHPAPVPRFQIGSTIRFQ